MSLRGATLTLALASIGLTSPVGAQSLQQVHVEGIQPHSLFGESIAIDGSAMVVGSRWDNERSNNAGAAYVFSREDGSLWEQVAKLKANDGQNSDYFGSDVGVSGDWAVVGASGFNRRQGAAYVFQRSGDLWVQRRKLVPSGNSARSVFGSAVSIDGNFLAVGAPDHFRAGSVRSGAVYVYTLNSGNWTQHAFILPGDAGSVDYVGTSVALSGDFLAIGSPGDGELRGAVYIFRRSGSSWVQQQKLIPGGSSVGDGIGMAVSMDENWLAIGAPHDDESVRNQGTVYIYRRSGNSFSLDRKVTAADPRVSQMFGFSVSVDGNELLVGAPGDRRGAGSAYRFSRDGSGTWRQQVKLTPEAVNTRAAFGRAVALGASDIVVGATGETGAQFQSGAVYSMGGGGILRQGFQSIEANFSTLRKPAMSFADADGDGDLDLAAYGLAGGGPRIYLYTNDGEDTFGTSDFTFEAPSQGFVGWSDIDNNGAMDLVVSGDFRPGLRTDVYLNDGSGSFTRVDLGIPGLKDPQLVWGDFDSDGDQDVVVSGTDETDTSVLMLLQHRPGHNFVTVDMGLPSLRNASADWGDYDNDGDPDLLLSGLDEAGNPVSVVYEKIKDRFRAENFNLPGLLGSVHWVDFNSDGLLDIFLCGEADSEDVRVVLLRNESSSAFTEVDTGLPALQSCSGAWGDFDNDGDDDLALTGTELGTRVTDVYENVGEKGFDESRFKLNRVSGGSISWVDYDRDGRLDLAVAGESDDGNLFEIYKNSVGFAQNIAPSLPRALRAEFNGNDVQLRWNVADDDRTPAEALTYNLRVGSTPGGIDVLAPNTTRNGFRSLSKVGNVGHARRFTLSGLSDGIYYWSVQAVDDAFEASEFAPEGSFIVGQSAQDFHDINATVAGVTNGASHWVDFRRSGYLDILLTGRNDRGPFAQMYRYKPKNGEFVETDIPIPAVDASSVSFGDYDNDLDLDMAIIGMTDGGRIARIYRNDNTGTITDISAPLVPVSNGDVEWADLDNDGDLELIVTGSDGVSHSSTVYVNNRHDEFSPAPVSFVRLSDGSIDVGDFDGDLDNDILLTGFDGSRPRTILYRNDGYPRFKSTGSFVGVSHGDGTLEDYDGDGDLDILVSGRGVDGPITQLYENRGNQVFAAVNTPLPNLEYSSISWGDYDNNGKMDVLLSGSTGTSNLTTVHRYMGAKDGFQILHIVDLPATRDGSVAVGDYDRDGRLDMLVSGEGGYFPTSRVIRNEMSQWENTPPSAPTGLDYRIDGNKLLLFWQASQDAETPSSSLTYDLRVSTTHGGSDIMAPNTRPNGSRLSVTGGNVGHNRRWTILDPPTGRITVSVHAVDGGLLASQSSAKLTLEIGEDQSSFTTAETALPGVSYGRASWVDLDGDGDEDVSIIGGPVPDEISAHYLNEGGGEFSEAEVAIPALAHATVAWGDYDNDGDSDLYVSGETEAGLAAYILRNDTDLVFIDIEAPLNLVESAAASWADTDNDGDVDLIVSGLGELGPETTIYRNRGNDKFRKTDVTLPGAFKASHDWADYDGDGDLDLLMTGSDGTFPVTYVLANENDGSFSEVDLQFVDVFDGSGDWVDVDSDGDFDVMITGHAFEGVVAKMYINGGGGYFYETPTPIPGVRISSTSWGDFDEDGDLDLAVAGWDGLERLTKVFGNLGGNNFSEVYTDMVGVSAGSVDWADADADGDLDLLVGGASIEAAITNVYLFDSSLGSGKGGTGKLATATEEDYGSDELPLPENGFLFKQSYPNPFANVTTVHFAVGRLQQVRLELYNVLGQLVDTPFDAQVPANIMTDARIDAGGLASGAYFLRIEGDTFTDTQTVVVNK